MVRDPGVRRPAWLPWDALKKTKKTQLSSGQFDSSRVRHFSRRCCGFPILTARCLQYVYATTYLGDGRPVSRFWEQLARWTPGYPGQTVA